MLESLQPLNEFASGMADLQLDRNPLAQEVIVIFNSVTRDHYQDSVLQEECRVKKMAVVKKDTDMEYVQQLGDLLLEDEDSIPWIVSMTRTGFPRALRLDDQILIDGLRYTISATRPANRSIDSIVNVSIYPDRTDKDELKLYNLTKLSDGYVDILYGGAPVQIGFTPQAVLNPRARQPFESIIMFPNDKGTVYIFDNENNKGQLSYQFV